MIPLLTLTSSSFSVKKEEKQDNAKRKSGAFPSRLLDDNTYDAFAADVTVLDGFGTATAAAGNAIA